MSRAVLGVFPPEQIGLLIEELSAAGVERATLSVAIAHPHAPPPSARTLPELRELRVDGAVRLDGVGPVAERAERFGTSGTGGRGSSSLLRAITREGIPEILARTYVSELEDGGAFLAARVASTRVGKVVALMNRHTRRTIATAGDELTEGAQLGDSVVRPFM